MIDIEIVLNVEGIRELLLSREIAGAVDRVADAIAAAAAATAGSHTVTSSDGAGGTIKTAVPVEMRRTSFATQAPLDDVPRSRSRSRSAVLVSHPTPTGREAGMRALVASLDAGQGAL